MRHTRDIRPGGGGAHMFALPGHFAPTVLIWFDPLRRVADAKLKQNVTVFAHYLMSEERRIGGRVRARKDTDQKRLVLAVEAITCNLLIAAMASGDACLAVPRSSAVMWGGGRYHNPVYGQHFRDAVDLMEQFSLLELISKGYRVGKKSQPTAVRATRQLAKHLPLGATDWTMFRRETEPEVIILKSKKDDVSEFSSVVEYEDTARVTKLRREILAINRWLQDAPITVLDSNPKRRVLLDREGQPIEPYRRSVRRVFNNRTWQDGGRLYGGFWMIMEREERFRLIRISDEEIANVDYVSLFPRLAYARAQADQPLADVYDINSDSTHRNGWKILTNALLFANKPLQRWPRGAREALPSGIKLLDAIRAIKDRHAPIAHLFERGLGFQLMRLESDLLIVIVTNLFKQGVVALPLHDSVLVARSHAEVAKDVMEQAFKLHTGSRCAFVKIDFGPI